MSANVTWKLEQAVRTRKCSVCGEAINPGVWHGKFNSNSQYSKNACMTCVGKLYIQLLEKNGFICERCGAINSTVAETQVGDRTENLCDHCHAKFAEEV